MPDTDAVAQRALDVARRALDEIVAFVGPSVRRDDLHQAMRLLHRDMTDDYGAARRRETWERHAADSLLMGTPCVTDPYEDDDPVSGARIAHDGAVALRNGDLPAAEAAGRTLVTGDLRDTNRDEYAHRGHLLLGVVRLREGDVDAAAAELRAAGECHGSPSLDSFGPDLSLAFELLKLGRSDDVLAYLSGVATFWTPYGLARPIEDDED